MNTHKADITFTSVTKSFFVQEDRTIKDVLPSIFLGKGLGKKHQVLQQISFNITKGETVGVVGKNGAGKSTILKLIAGVTFAESGKVEVNGQVAPLIELGAGFHHELSGYENIFLNAALLGMTKAEVDSKLEDIIEFSGIEEFIHTPVKRYSSGMYMRLGFSIAVHTSAPILLIDEVLAVGDTEFQKKCLEKLESMKGKRTIVFVSHDERAIEKFCERVIVMNDGKIIEDAEPATALKVYQRFLK